MSTVPDLERLISASLLRIRKQSPFFATLALFTRIQITQQVEVAATNGQDIFINPVYLTSLPASQLDGLLIHEVLHAALLHVFRRGQRVPEIWNMAADIVVNGMIVQQGAFMLPSGALRDPQLENLSVEEIYEILFQQGACHTLPVFDLLEGKQTEVLAGSTTRQASLNAVPLSTNSAEQLKSQIDLEAHWRHALQQALTIDNSSKNQGNAPAGMQRELSAVTQSQLDWRSYLWRYIVQTPTDFQGFDRRFIHQRIYLESLQEESVRVFVAVDTSGSISDAQLQAFLDEVQGILGAYPKLLGELYYADAQVYGPYLLDLQNPLPQPVGRGGTSFIPFFEKIALEQDWHLNALCVYLTDGYGTFPTHAPQLPVLWVVTAGGLDLSKFPFGETVRLFAQT